MLGISFDRYMIDTGEVERFDHEKADWLASSPA